MLHLVEPSLGMVSMVLSASPVWLYTAVILIPCCSVAEAAVHGPCWIPAGSEEKMPSSSDADGTAGSVSGTLSLETDSHCQEFY
jgi:hypothetical protein